MRTFWILLVLLFSSATLCSAQSPTDVETLIRNSKLVETSRPLRVVTGAAQLNISTYVDKNAADKDCKITALLMAKEIVQKYPKVKSVKVNFFDMVTASTYRSVTIDRKLVAMVDSGNPAKSILSGINVSKAAMPTREPAARARQVSTAAGGTSNNYISSTAKDATFVCRRGNFSIVCPAQWKVDPRLHDDEVFKVGASWHAVSVSIDHTSVQERLEDEERFYRSSYPSYKKLSAGVLPSRDKEGLLVVGTFVDGSMPTSTHRAIFREPSTGQVFTIELFAPGDFSMDAAKERLMRILASFKML